MLLALLPATAEPTRLLAVLELHSNTGYLTGVLRSAALETPGLRVMTHDGAAVKARGTVTP